MIHFDNVTNGYIRDLEVRNGYSRGIEVDYPDFVVVENVISHDNYRNYMHWVSPSDLKSWDGVAIFRNVKSYNANNNGFDGTSPTLIIDGFMSKGDGTSIAIDGYKRIILRNIHAEKGINIGAGAWTGNIAVDAILDGIYTNKIYMWFSVGANGIKISNVTVDASGGNGVELHIKSDSNVEYVLFDNVEVKNFAWAGIVLTRDSTVAGRFSVVEMTNIVARDGAQRGFYIYYVDYLRMTNCVAKGNDWRGFVIANSNYVEMVNCSAIKSGAYNQDGPLDLNTVTTFRAIGCHFETGGVNATLTSVTDYRFDGCSGNYPKTNNSGTTTFTGDGSTTTFTIPHGLVAQPSKYFVQPLNADARAYSSVSADATNISVTFDTAPASGTTLTFYWYAEV